MFSNIYTNKLLRYPLTEEEEQLIPEVWEFVRIFRKRYVFVTDYRNYLIDTVSSRYTPEQFYKYETILNKMFWNLRWMLFPLWIDQLLTKEEYADFIKEGYGGYRDIPYSLLLCTYKKYPKEYTNDDIRRMIRGIGYDTTFYRSFINKLVFVDRESHTVVFKPMEGSSEIFSKNYFNLMTTHILLSPSRYEHTMRNPYKSLMEATASGDIFQPSHYYYQLDYGFPNLNLCLYSIGSKADKLDRIKKLYYYDAQERMNRSAHWFKLII